MSGAGQLVVIAKEPVPGRVKTRLCPPCTPAEAAAIAEASLADTLATVAATDLTAGSPGGDGARTRRTLALDGRTGPWLPAGFDVIAQEGDGLDERLTAAFAHCLAAAADEPAILIGMDTPQVTSAHLTTAAASLAAHDAVLGPAPDGGYWLIGLRHLRPDAIVGVPMSAADTFDRQLERLRSCGYDVGIVEALDDVDDAAGALAVAATVPGSRFATAVAQVPRLGPTPDHPSERPDEERGRSV